MRPEPVVHSPAIARSSELLPQPLGPSISRPWPSLIVSDRSRISRCSRCGVITATCSSAKSRPGSVSMRLSLRPPPASSRSSARLNSCSRFTPAPKRLRLSKCCTISVSAPSMAEKAPAAWIARPTSISPDSTWSAMMMLGSAIVRKLWPY